MSFRDILVCVDDSDFAAGRMRVAAELASRFKAELTGVFVEPPLPNPAIGGEFGGYVPPTIIDEMVRDHRKRVEGAADVAFSRFETAAAEVTATSEPMVVAKASSGGFFAAARCYDLVVCGAKGVGDGAIEGLSAADVVLGCGGPVLLAPDIVVSPTVGRRIIVAWNGTRESARALRDAWPLLSEAEAVMVVVAGGADAGAEPLLQRHFERHGHQVEVLVDRSGVPAEEVIRIQAEGFDADLVVMGLYGHSRFKEFVLGGVSRSMLAQRSLPLFVSH